MPKIVIDEIDNTSPGSSAENFDVVYIPGFVNVAAIGAGGECIAPRVPTLFTSVDAFNTLCGTAPATFDRPQYFRSLNSDKTIGFANDAVPSNGVMFEAGDSDPSYIMAKELLAAGLNVVYERVNPDRVVKYQDVSIEDFTEQLDVDEVNTYGQQILLHIPAYRPISSSVAPVFFKHVESKVSITAGVTFYKCNEEFANPDTLEVPFDKMSDYDKTFTTVSLSGNATEEEEYGIEKDTAGNYFVVPTSKLYINSCAYYSADGTDDSAGLPLVLDSAGDIITSNKPVITAIDTSE